MDIKHIDLQPLEREISVTIQPEDYADKVKSELKKISKQGMFKGFRKGKVPMSYLKKTHGKSILAQEVYKLLEENLNDYIHAHEMKIIGQPITSDKQGEIEFNVNKKEDYVFVFEVGIAPEFELNGFDESHSYERYDVTVGDEIIDEEIEGMRKQLGEQVEVDGDINDNDIVVLEGKELEDGEVKKDGWETAFSIHVGSLNDEVQKELIGKDKGASFKRDIYDLAKEGADSFVRKHYLNIDEDEDVEVNKDFQLTVSEIKRLELAEMNEDFFEKAFAGRAENEEEARTLIRTEVKKQFDRQADAMLSHTMRDALLEENELDLPLDFLHKWLDVQQAEDDKELSDEEFNDFLKNMRWSLITSKIREEYELKVTEEEIGEGIRSQVMQQFQGYQLPEEFMQQFIQTTAQDKEKVQEIADKILGDKIVAAFKENVTIEDKPVSIEEFNDISKEFIERINAESGADEEE